MIAKSPRQREKKKRHLVRDRVRKKADPKARASALSPWGHNFIARIGDIASKSSKSAIERKREKAEGLI